MSFPEFGNSGDGSRPREDGFPIRPNWEPLPPWDPTKGAKSHAAWAAIVERLWYQETSVQWLVGVAAHIGQINEGTVFHMIREAVKGGYLVVVGGKPYHRRHDPVSETDTVELSSRFRRHLTKDPS